MEEITADDEKVKKVVERIKRNLSLSHGTKILLKVQQEVNRELSESLDEEKRIVKERDERAERSENMLRERDIQIIDLKTDASKRERKARPSQDELRSVEKNPSHVSRARQCRELSKDSRIQNRSQYYRQSRADLRCKHSVESQYLKICESIRPQ